MHVTIQPKQEAALMPLLRSSRCPSFETILPISFDSKTIADEIVRTRPDVALVSGMLHDSSFAGYSVLTIQPLNLATRLILLLEDRETDLVTHGSSLLSKREEEVVALVAVSRKGRRVWLSAHNELTGPESRKPCRTSARARL
jgi:hypothetical protein